MAKQTQRFGLIGTGVAAETHARELQHVNHATLVAVWARDEANAARFASAHSVPRHYHDLTAFLADPDIDVVIIMTPNGTHREYAIAAARAGKHIVVEKPLEINEARAQAIIDACTLARKFLFVIYQRRFSRAALQAIEDVSRGKLGQIILVNIVDNQSRPPHYYERAGWRGTRTLEGGGCVITQSTHMLDLAQFIVGPVRSVFAQTRTAVHRIETEDVATALLQFAGGAMGTFSSSTAGWPGQRHLLTITGTEGSIILNGEHDQILFRRSRHDHVHVDVPPEFSFEDPIDPRDYPTAGQRIQLERIVAALNGEDVQSGQNDPLLAVRVIDAIYRSAASGRMVDILPVDTPTHHPITPHEPQ